MANVNAIQVETQMKLELIPTLSIKIPTKYPVALATTALTNFILESVVARIEALINFCEKLLSNICSKGSICM